MSTVRLQGNKEKEIGIYYEFDPATKPLGEGGMGKVYRGKRVNLHTHETRDVAIKFMFSGLHETVIDRARREASIIIPHENLIEMMGFFTVNYTQADGSSIPRYHVVSEFLQGVNLSDLMQGVVTDQYGKPVAYAKKLYALYNTDPQTFAVTIIKKLLSGIMALHDHGFIHRDIDPSNIMITTDGKIKLIDFGIAKRIDGLVTNDKNFTTAGIFMGKPQYAAPELVLGDIKNQSPETDIYALGILMYQLIVGHLPFEGTTQQILGQHLRNKMPLKDIKDRGLRKIIDQATAKDQTKRYHSAAEFRVALDEWHPGASPIDWKMISYGIGGLAAAIILVCGIVFAINQFPKQDHEKPIPVPETTREKLLNTETAAEGLKELRAKADKKDIESMFLLSQLYTKPYRTLGLDNDILTMQGNLTKELQQDPGRSHTLLLEIQSIDNTYYPALYELARDYYIGPELTGHERQDRVKTKRLLDQAHKYSSEAQDRVYNAKIEGMLRLYSPTD